MNSIFDRALRVQEEVPEASNDVDVTAEWFRQKEARSLRMGRRSDYPQSTGTGSSFASWDYLQHYDGPQELSGPARPLFEQGLRLTRFKKGMFRRNYKDICQDKDRLEREAQKEVFRAEHADRRRKYLEQQDKKNGYNVLNGAETTPYKWKPSVRYLPGELSHNLAREGLIRLRDSSDRFYIPHYSGPAHDYRQKVMCTEGLLKPKLSTIVGVGKPQLASYGVEDQFSHSDYTPLEPCKPYRAVLLAMRRYCIYNQDMICRAAIDTHIQVTGLYESTQPGRYTPQQFPKKTAQYLYPLHRRPNSGSSHKTFVRPASSSQAISSPVATLPVPDKVRSAPATAHAMRREVQRNQEVEAVRALP